MSREDLFDRDTNLRIGFRYLRTLMVKYNGNLELALLAYNRGPERVDQLLRAGQDPNNGYVAMVLGKRNKRRADTCIRPRPNDESPRPAARRRGDSVLDSGSSADVRGSATRSLMTGS